MHAFLVHRSPDLPDLPETPDTLHIHPDTSIGIEQIRSIQTFLSRKPLQSPHNTVVIFDAHLLTLPAQNALLKTLEEPPGASQIYLVTTNPDILLPTILSRVHIISSPDLPETPDFSHSSALLNQLLSSPISQRLQILDAQAFTRDSALQFLADLEHIIHHNLSVQGLALYDLIVDTRKYLKANCNLKLCLSHFATNISKM